MVERSSGTSFRNITCKHIDKCVSGTLFTAVADLLHHLRSDLSPANLSRIFTVYVQLLHNPYLSTNMHLMCAKVILHLIEIEVGKDSHANAARVLTMLLEACVDKVDSLVSVQGERLSKTMKDKDAASEFKDFVLIEKSRPLVNLCYASEKPEEHVIGRIR